MPKLSQKSFVSGQYDRIAQNQESISGGGVVASGLSYAKNVLSSDRGELRKRLGTKYLKTLGKASVIIPFRMPNDDDAILVVDDTHITGYNYVDGQLDELMSLSSESAVSFPAGNTWPNGGATATNGDWTISTSMGNQPGKLLNGSIGSNYPARSAPQSVTFYNSSQDVCLRSIKFRFRGARENYYTYKYWYNPVIEYSDDGVEWLGVQTNYEITEKQPEGCVDISGLGYICFAQCSGIVSQSNYSEGHRYWRVYFQSGSLDPALDTVMIREVSFVDVSVVEPFQKTSPYTEEQLKKIKYSQDKNSLFIACEDVIPQKLLNQTGQFTFGSFTPANTSTLWQTFGYPSAVSLFQNRLWFGGFTNNPQTVIASKFGDYDTFNTSTPAQKDDRLELRCNQLKSRIRNMIGGQNVLYCFSQDGISNVDAKSSEWVATNENIEFLLKNRMPAGDATPAFKDDVMLYSSSDGTKLYGVDFDLLVNRFEVADLAKYAKDVTKGKITELHYVNNESKLVYGLTEEGKMFALLYEKGQYQGFFPLEIGEQVYDICPIKVGREYKLLMVVFRDGQWYLEEKLDAGNYIDTSKPRLTAEEKKWATYDNLENNIALDCYQTYDNAIVGDYAISENSLVSSVDLSSYIDKTVMLGNPDDNRFIIVSIDGVDGVWGKWISANLDFVYTNSVTPSAGDDVYNRPTGVVIDSVDSANTLYGWGVVGDDTLNAYTTKAIPEAGDVMLDKYGVPLMPIRTVTSATAGFVNFSYHEEGADYYFTWNRSSSLDHNVIVIDNTSYISDTEGDYTQYNVTMVAERGNETHFSIAYPEFTQFQPNLSRIASIAVISEGRYFNAQQPDENGYIMLPVPVHKVIYGEPYEALAIIKMQTPYESLKNVAQVDLSVINSTHLEVGTNFDDTQNIEKIDDSSYYDLTRITMNDTYRLVLSDTPETVKNLILRSNKGVPFTVNAIDMYVNYSNLGGD